MAPVSSVDLDRFYIPARWDFKNATNKELYSIWKEGPNPTVLREIIIEMEMRWMLNPKRIPGSGYPEPTCHLNEKWRRIQSVYYDGRPRTRAEAMKSLGIHED